MVGCQDAGKDLDPHRFQFLAARALMNSDENAALSLKWHPSMGDQEVVDQQKVSALPAKPHGRIFDCLIHEF